MYRQGHPSWEACILITSGNPDNRRFGTGFIVCHFEQKSYIITCAHVISDIGGIDSIEADGQSATIVALGADDGLDLAVIETDEILGKPIVRLGTCGSTGSPFFTAGFRAFGRHFSITPLYGKIAAPVSLESNNYSDRIKAWNLTIERDERLHDGYSGSPVIDEETGFCLGVISYKQGDGQSGLAVSIDELAKIWQKMPVDLLGKPLEQQTYQDRLFSRATQSYITGDLAEALHFYQEIRKVEPSYPRLDIMLRSVKNEMKKGYVDRYGRINARNLSHHRHHSGDRGEAGRDLIQVRRDYIHYIYNNLLNGNWGAVFIALIPLFLFFLFLYGVKEVGVKMFETFSSKPSPTESIKIPNPK